MRLVIILLSWNSYTGCRQQTDGELSVSMQKFEVKHWLRDSSQRRNPDYRG